MLSNYVFFAVNVLDNLCSLLKTLTRKEVSACVKIINPNDNLTFDSATVSTFCRSSNSNPERFILDETYLEVEYIKDNTIYNEIVSPGRSQGSFYECDLREYVRSLEKKGEKFLNTNPEWQKYYESAVVVPIRFLNRRSPKDTDQDSYTLLGFLCVDSMSRNAFLQSKQAYYTSIIRADADAFAVILWNYKRIIERK